MVTTTDIFQKVGIPTCSAQCSFAGIQVSPLSPWTRSTGHASNKVIAGQPNCPPDMSLDAFRAFGHLRSDLRLQWAMSSSN